MPRIPGVSHQAAVRALRKAGFSNVTITDAWLFNTDVSGAIHGLKINGVEVEPMVEAELDRRHPERTKLRPIDVAGLRVAFDVVEKMWTPTIERARKLPQSKLHERVNGEYSFVETMRHLIFATDSWLLRTVLRIPNAYHEWAVPPDLPPDAPPDTGPELDPVVEVRAERLARIRDYLSTATDADLATVVSPPDSGHPQGDHRFLDCFLVVLNEEWWHNRYANRDLGVLET
jgi:hypothetical protein